MTNTIRVERAIMDITQDELGTALGLSRQSVHAIERNKYMPSGVLMMRIARFFGKKVEDIFDLEEDEKSFNPIPKR